MSKDYERPELPCADLIKGQHDALRKAAEAATPGPWGTDDTVIVSKAPWPMEDGPEWCDWEAPRGEPIGRFVGETRTDDTEGQANAAFIALANPATVLALLDRINALEETRRPLVGALEEINAHLNIEREAFVMRGPAFVVRQAEGARAIALAALAAAKEPS